MNNSKSTIDHETIVKWAEERGGKPAKVKSTEDSGDGSGLLRINFPGYAEESLRQITWDEFFETFDDKQLSFLYQEESKDGEESRFFKLLSKETAQ